MNRKIIGSTVGTPIKPQKVIEMSNGCVSEEERELWNSKVDKKYVDTLVGSVETILTELHTYAGTLQSGGNA